MLTEILTLLRRARGAIRSEVIPHKVVFSRIASPSSRRARPAYAPANHFSGKCPEKCSSDRNLGWDHHGKHCTQTNTAPEKLLVGREIALQSNSLVAHPVIQAASDHVFGDASGVHSGAASMPFDSHRYTACNCIAFGCGSDDDHRRWAYLFFLQPRS